MANEMKTLTIGSDTFKVVDGDAVHCCAQALTEEQKAQACANIGMPYEESGIVEVLSHTIETEDDMFLSSPIGLVVGREYTVSVNGNEETCIAQAGEDEGFVFTTLTTAEWMIMDFPADVTAATGMGAAFEPLGDATVPSAVSIKGEGTIAHTIDPKYLPSALFVSFNASTMTADKNSAEIWAAMQNNQSVFLVSASDWGSSYSPCVFCVPNAGACFIGTSLTNQNGELSNVGRPSLICVKADGSVKLGSS